MKRTICFDGSVYEHLQNGKDENSKDCRQVKKLLTDKIDSLIKEGECEFLSGVRRGIEMWSAEIVLDKMEVYPNISLTCICPYEEQPTRWNEDHRERYFTIHQLCTKLIMIGRHYEADCFQKLDNYLLDHCDTLITIQGYEESKMVKKARAMNKTVIVIQSLN